MHDSASDLLARHPLFAGLDDGLCMLLRGALVPQRFRPGDVLLREGEAGDSLYVVVEGEAEVRKRVGGSAQGVVINHVRPGDVLGELSFLGGDTRSSSVVATRPGLAWSLRRAALAGQGLAGRAAAVELDARIAHVLASRLRLSTQRHADALEARLADHEERREFGRLFVATVAVVAMSILVALTLRDFVPGLDPHSATLNWLLLLLLAVPMVVMVKVSHRPLADFGLTWVGGRRAALEGLAWGLASVAAMAASLHLGSPGGLRVTWNDTLWAYPLHVVLQEFVSRGVIQGSLQRFLDDRRGLVSIVLSALLFGLAHMIYGLGAIAVTFVSGIAFGAMYRRHGNLVGISVLHALAGLAAFAFGVI